jgi:uncharacterized protein YciI
MLFVAICYDKPESTSLRLANRAAHLDFLRAQADRIKVCGPLLGSDNETMIGSMLIVEAADKSSADALLANDPYRKAGLFASSELHPWRWVVGAPVGMNVG